MYTSTDILNLICFVIVTIIASIGILIVTKMKLPIWKFQILQVTFLWLVGVVLLISRLSS